MSTVDVTSNISLVKISQISKLDYVQLPEVSIHGIPWTVDVYKFEEEEGKHSLAAFLHCKKRGQSNWTHAAASSFELLSFDDNQNPVKCHSIPYVFDSERGYGTRIISWNELFNGSKKYVKDGSIKMNVGITIEDPKQPNKSKLKFQRLKNQYGYEANIQLTVVNVANLLAVRSPQIEVRGMWCDLTVFKDHKSHIGIFLQCKSESVPCKAMMTAKLVSSNKDGIQIEKTITSKMKQSETLKLQDIVSWTEMFKPENGFVNNNSIVFEVGIKTANPQDNFQNAAIGMPKLECSICLSNVINEEISCTPCGHTFCSDCIAKVVEDYGVCPLCKEVVRSNALRRIFLPM